MENEIQKALKTLNAGGTILYPTDTVWGIGCDATNEKAVEKVLAIKEKKTANPTLKGEGAASPFRDLGKTRPFIILVSNDGMLNRYVKEVPEIAWELMDANKKENKSITIIYDGARGLAKNILAEDGSVAIRLVPGSAEEFKHFCHRLIHKFGKPIISTSANTSGDATPQHFTEIAEGITSGVDYVVKLPTPNSQLPTHNSKLLTPNSHLPTHNTQLPTNTPSSIIKLNTNGEVKVIRE